MQNFIYGIFLSDIFLETIIHMTIDQYVSPNVMHSVTHCWDFSTLLYFNWILTWHNNSELDMSMARQRLKSPRSLSGTSALPTMVTQVNIMVMNGWLSSFRSLTISCPIPETKLFQTLTLKLQSQGHGCGQRARSYNWPNIINSLPFHFTSIRPTIPEMELYRNLTLKHPRFRSWVRSKVKVTYFTQ